MFYLLLRAAGSFATTHKRAPGSELAVGQSGPADRKADAELLRAELAGLLSGGGPAAAEGGGGSGLDADTAAACLAAADPYIDEMCRVSATPTARHLTAPPDRPTQCSAEAPLNRHRSPVNTATAAARLRAARLPQLLPHSGR